MNSNITSKTFSLRTALQNLADMSRDTGYCEVDCTTPAQAAQGFAVMHCVSNIGRGQVTGVQHDQLHHSYRVSLNGRVMGYEMRKAGIAAMIAEILETA